MDVKVLHLYLNTKVEFVAQKNNTFLICFWHRVIFFEKSFG